MKEKFHKTREVFKIKNHLYRIAPSLSDVDIKIKQLKTGRYKTQILAQIPKRKRIVTTKIDESLPDALEKAHQATIKQIDKVLNRSPKRKTIKKLILSEAA